MAAIAVDVRRGFENGLPSADVTRAFWACNKDISFRNIETKEEAYFRGGTYNHVETHANARQQVEASNPGIFTDGFKLWNIEGTALNAAFGQHVKVCSSSDTRHGGFRASSANIGTGKHLTAVFVTSASDKCLPPFFVAG